MAERKKKGRQIYLVLLLVVLLANMLPVMMNSSSLPKAPLDNPIQSTIASTTQFTPQTKAKACPMVDATLPQNSQHLKAQSNEDTVLLQWFNGLCEGTYFEMGALDGVTFSNTYFFNRVLQWKGLLVEFSPISFKKLVQNRPNEQALVHAAVCNPNDDTSSPKILHFVEAELAAVNGIWEFTTESFRELWWKGLTIEQATPVACRSLADIIMENDEMPTTATTTTTTSTEKTTNHHHYFDFMSLDCEGCEWTALQSIDWTRTAFGILVIESDRHNERKNLAVRQLLQAQGYIYETRRTTKERNDWFVHPQFHTIYQHLLHGQQL